MISESIVLNQYRLHGIDLRYNVTELILSHPVRNQMECANLCARDAVCNSYHVSMTSSLYVVCQLTWYYERCLSNLLSVTELNTNFYVRQ